MLPAIEKNRHPVKAAATAQPFISVFLPFDPKITARETLATRLERAVMQVKEELDRHYATEETFMLMARLRKLVASLNYSTYKKSIAIFLSATTEKVCYLDLELQEYVVADGALTMRHIVQKRKPADDALLLLLSADRLKIFHAKAGGLKRILSATPYNMSSRQANLPERVGNFSDPAALKETMLDKFMRYADHSLSMILSHYPFPVIMMAAERTGGHFKKISGNTMHIAASIHGNFEDVSESHILHAIAPYGEQWQNLRQQHVLAQLETAMGAGRVSAGIRNVCKDAAMRKGRLLLVEENYRYKLTISAKDKAAPPFYLEDKVDEAILSVLESGGQVEFVNDGALTQYGQVALITYY